MDTSDPVVYVIDDDDAVRESLKWLISSIDIEVKVFASATNFLEQCHQVSTGCLITDVRMPGLSGLDLQNELKKRGIEIPVVVITGHGDVQMAVRAMKAGVFDFIEKPFNDQYLLDLVNRAVIQSQTSKNEKTHQDELRARLETLTPREQEVMELIVDGEANKNIALKLGISDKTVEAHRAKVMTKMQAHSLPELVKMVLELS